jgi:Skp family chaperone for outer membrane proteins
MNINRIGWIAVAILSGAVLTAGFQTPTNKSGIVDVEKVFNESNFSKSQSDNLRNMQVSRVDILEFLNTYQTMKAEDIAKFRELKVKATPLSETEKAELERIRKDAQAGEQKYRDTVTKPSPTPDELKFVEDMNKRKDANGDLLQKWSQEFDNEVKTKQLALRNEALGKVRQAIGKVARDQGYSMVFDSNVAPYSANDLTDEALKAMNAMK